MKVIIWIGIGICISQSAFFSGLNLAFFSISKLRLEIESKKNNRHAIKVARLRENSNFLLTTILWGNVGINVLLTLLSNSVMAGAAAFVFSTFIITFLGEIIPQAYFSRHALKTASLLSPLLRMYQIILFPVAKPTAVILDKWLGSEAIQFFREEDFREMLKLHMESENTEIEKIEGVGALNFLALDDLPVYREGEPIAEDSIMRLEFIENKPICPKIERSATDPFLKSIQASQKKWVIFTDSNGEPKMTLDCNRMLRAALFEQEPLNPIFFCHRPIVIRDESVKLGDVVPRLKVHPERSGDDVIDEDIILFWGREKRIITGSDILGRLLRGIVQQKGMGFRRLAQVKEAGGA